ncbi:hypothetical protein ILUMI_09025 [Ignelater luminosus]|uniref:Fucosyltransferase n=1 Tax=Ignelater luminosus TaxID=2038154 RepID=A0A8K0GA27_IGNLU|nr:hypothetical protein ILUMI_09025 [Ignelater luminosus]
MLRFIKKKLFLAIAILTLVYFIYFANKKFRTVISENHNAFRSKSSNDTKVLLYWTPFWNTWHYFMGYGFEPFKDCEYKNCYATKDRNLVPLEEVNALLFHTSYNKEEHGVPWIRLPHQVYIIMNVEAPIYIYADLKSYASYFNWTMTYRFDSDIVRRHGFVFKEETGYKMPSKEFVQNKTKLAAWMVTNCRTPGRREELGKEIQKFMNVDVYGRCGNLTCAKKKGDPKISAAECYDMIEKNYKFYFAWENSYCTDYATEKLYNVLVKDVVPVVYGAGDYKRAAPPNSVLNVADFENASKLAEYLKYLDKNTNEYLKYFEWKKHYRITLSPMHAACQICKKLHEPLKQSIYDNLDEWWWGKNNSICKQEENLPKIVSDLL